MLTWTENNSNKHLFQVFECKFGCIKYFVHTKTYSFIVLGREFTPNAAGLTLEIVQRQFEHALRNMCIEINNELNVFQVEDKQEQNEDNFTGILNMLKKYCGK